MGKQLFPSGKLPSREIIWDQIQLAQLSTTVYAMLPVLAEFVIEEDYTWCVPVSPFLSPCLSLSLSLSLSDLLLHVAVFFVLEVPLDILPRVCGGNYRICAEPCWNTISFAIGRYL